MPSFPTPTARRALVGAFGLALTVPSPAWASAPSASGAKAGAAPEAGSSGEEGPVPEEGSMESESATAEADPEGDATDSAEVPGAPAPPRVDGPYVGGTFWPSVMWGRIQQFDTPGPLWGGGLSLRAGDVIYPWMTLGFEIVGNFARQAPDLSSLAGHLLVDFGFMPAPKKANLSLRAAFGFGGGRIKSDDPPATATRNRGGFGGASFRVAARYETFPGAKRYRARRGGGVALGPEVGWIVNPPTRAGNPMASTIYLAIGLAWYGGR